MSPRSMACSPFAKTMRSSSTHESALEDGDYEDPTEHEHEAATRRFERGHSRASQPTLAGIAPRPLVVATKLVRISPAPQPKAPRARPSSFPGVVLFTIGIVLGIASAAGVIDAFTRDVASASHTKGVHGAKTLRSIHAIVIERRVLHRES